MRYWSSFLLRALGITVIAAATAAAQSDALKPPRPSADQPSEKAAEKPAEKMADETEKPKDTPATPAPKPAPVKYTELKKTVWPPKAGVKTPGVLIPMTNLKPEAEISIPGPTGSFVFTANQVLISIPGGDQILRVDGRSNKALEPFSRIAKPCGGIERPKTCVGDRLTRKKST